MRQKAGIQRMRNGIRPSLPLSAAFIFALSALSGCTMLDYKRADGGINTSANAPWAVDSAAGGNLAKLGAEQNPRILAAYGGEYHDVKLERMVAKIVGRLTAVSDNPGQTYRVVILDSPNVNAFALPGGYVYVSRGLLGLANDSAEVAAVIAHEMEHINANHGLQRRDKEQQIAISDQVANDILSGQERDETLIRGKLKLSAFSREQELQADAGGQKMVAAAGYDPFASPRFLQAMEDYGRFRDISGAKNAGLDFLSNHPSTPQRVRIAVENARRLSAPGVGDIDRDSFLRGINGMIYGDSVNEYGFYIRGRTLIDTQSGVTFTVPQGFVLSSKDNVVMASGAGDTALRFDSAAVKKPQTAAAYIASGWISGLDKSTVQSITLNGLPAAKAVAQNDKWLFEAVVLMDAAHGRAYRFLTAAPKTGQDNKSSGDPAAIALAAVNSFRLLSAQEKTAVKPLRIRIAVVKPGDTVESLANAMQFNDRSLELFRIINGLAANQQVHSGDKVKLIMQ